MKRMEQGEYVSKYGYGYMYVSMFAYIDLSKSSNITINFVRAGTIWSSLEKSERRLLKVLSISTKIRTSAAGHLRNNLHVTYGLSIC